MPYFLVEGQSIYDKLHQPKFLVDFLESIERCSSVENRTRSLRFEFVDFNVIPLDPQVAEVFGMNQVLTYVSDQTTTLFISAEVSLKQNIISKLTTQ